MSKSNGQGKVDDTPPYTSEEHQLFIEERKLLIDAARESSRTFDQAVLAFGSAALGASIAFLKDISPHPTAGTLWILIVSWSCLVFGLLSVMLSFLLSHRACMFEIDEGYRALTERSVDRKKNRYSPFVNGSNIACIVLLFLGVLFWVLFAANNLK